MIPDKLTKHAYIDERQVLRILAFLYNKEGKIEDTELVSKINAFGIEIDKEKLEETMKPFLYTAYYNKSKRYHFIHKNIQDYLLAEYYYYCIKNGIESVDAGIPTKRCIDYLHVIIDMLKHYDEVGDILMEYKDIPLLKEEDKDRVITNAINILKKELYSSNIIYKWISASILTWLLDSYDEAFSIFSKCRIELIKLIKYSENVPSYLKNLSNANLSNANLSNANLSRAYLFLANLSNADLSNANLSNANLSRVNLSRAYLFLANLSNADLSNADLSKVILPNADLFLANLSNANLSRAYLILADFSNANLSRANLSNADLFLVNLSNANLSRANLSNANLSRVNLSNADITNVIFYLFSWEDEDIRNSNLANYIELFYGIDIREYNLTRNNNKITLTKDDNEITIELKDNKAILTIYNYELELDVIKEDKQTKIFIPIKVNKYTKTKGIILTYSNNKEDIIKALSNLHPNLREIVLRDNPNYKEIWK